jgi:nitroreductase
MMLKKILKLMLPQAIFNFLKIKRNYFVARKNLRKAYKYDLKRYSKYSESYNADTAQKLIGRIIREYHVVEKGLTMPETRLGFGKTLLVSLAKDCIRHIQKYGKEDEQLLHAVGVIWEYEKLHKDSKFHLDEEITLSIKELKQTISDVPACSQKQTTKTEYFRFTETAFSFFSDSRSSIRNYSDEEVTITKIEKALNIARNTPSACNRQCWRTYIFADRSQIEQILVVQGGNRGFGHLTNKLIVLVAEIGVFTGVGERNEAFVDGGMYAMNLLYALHYENIATCILNCSNSVDKDKRLRTLCDIKESEVFIAMIACGIPPQEFKIAASKRYGIEKTNITLYK